MAEHVIYGVHPVKEAIDAGGQVEKILIRQDMAPDKIGEWRRLAKEIDVPLQMVPEIKLNKVTKNANHQGIVAMVSARPYHDLEETILRVQADNKTALFLMLDSVTDVRNFGAIARSAECLGAHALIVPARGSASLNADAVKVSAGALNHIPVCRVNDLVDATLILQAYDIQTIGLTEKSNDSIWETDFSAATCLVLGSEEKGISTRLLKRITSIIKIPLQGNVDSLNVSVAAGITLAEVKRQRNQA